jgi:NitT/TauT family transport system substrate-binding protein
LEFKSEATEVAAILAEDPSKIAVLPQPFATVACAQNPELKIAFTLEDEWAAKLGTGMVTGVTIVRNEFLEAHRDAVVTFIMEHEESVEKCYTELDKTAKLVVAQGIIGKEAIAKDAIPLCNVTCTSGQQMKDTLSSFLEILYKFDEKSVGGKLPPKEFYFYKPSVNETETTTTANN